MRPLPYLQRLVQDEYVQEQLRDAIVGLYDAYRRASTKRHQVVEDKKLYGSLRRAATSIRNATFALRPPEPPRKHRVRKLLIIGSAAGGALLLARFASNAAKPAASTEQEPLPDG
jgi:hypothetical protein